MHSKEYTELAQVADEMSCVVLAFAPQNEHFNSYVVVLHNPDAERYQVVSVRRMQFRDGTFMQWYWERELGNTEDLSLAMTLLVANIKKALVR